MFAAPVVVSADRSERVDHNYSRLDALCLDDNPIENFVEILIHHFGTQIHKLNCRAGHAGIEVAELALVAQHFQSRFTEHREVQRRSLDGRIREHYLMGENCFPRPRPTRDQIERVLWQAAAQYCVQPRHSARKTSNSRLRACVLHASSRRPPAIGPLRGKAAKLRSISIIDMSSPMSLPSISTRRTSSASSASPVAGSPCAMMASATPST